MLSAGAVWFFYAHGWTFYYGDAEAHWNIARRIVDSQTPGYDQIGTVWLPLPHVLMLPLARVDSWWQNGLSAAIPSAISFVVAGGFLFATVRRTFDSAAAAASTVLFAGNPNLLYLQSTAMTEVLFFACLLALLYFTVRFQQTQGWGSVAGAGISCCLATLTRYEGWLLIPFAAAYFCLQAKRRRLAVAALFSIVAALGPAYWLAHNWWLSGDPLEFYRGPYSAVAIQGSASYPGRANWRLAWLYFRTAAELCTAPGLWWMGMAGMVAALAKRVFWPILFLALPGLFYIWSMHSSATPVFVPTLWPNTFYNTRYGLAVLPFLAVASAGLVAVVPRPAKSVVAGLVVAAGLAYWALHPTPESWITWKESQVNSQGRRAWVREAAEYLAPRYVRGSRIFTSFGDLTAIFRQAGIPLHETFTGDNGLLWVAAVARPDLFLRQEWAIVRNGEAAQGSVIRAGRYRLEKTITVKDSPVIEIYRRIGGRHGSA